MSVTEVAKDVQIFNNAAFDSCGGGGGMEIERSLELKSSWTESNQKSLSVSIESDNSSKENHNPLISESQSPALFKTPVSNSLFKTPIETTAFSGSIGSRKSATMIKDSTLRDEAMIDMEIKQTEIEMNRLSSKLEALKLEKAEMKKQRIRERRCSIVPAKYMESISKQSTDSKTGYQRRGMSLCPAEIYSATKSRQSMTKPDVSISNLKQSSFRKLGDIDELKGIKARGGIKKSASVSPKQPPRVPIPKFDASKKAATTNGLKKLIPKNDGVLSSVQPKRLFKESEKPIKSGRVIPSRYSLNLTQNLECVDPPPPKVRPLCESEGRVKKRWEIPAKGNVVVYTSNDEESKSTVDVNQTRDGLRKIRTVRCVKESPRDSGAVKRVADLVGKKSFFADEDSEVRQALSFVDEEEESDAENEAQN